MCDLVDFENTYDDFDEIGNHFIYIDGYPEDEYEEGRVVAVVIKTPHNDIVVDWHDNGYRYHNTVIELIKESIKELEGE